MNPWIIITICAAVTGLLSGVIVRGVAGTAVGAALSWLGVLAWLLIVEYVLPYSGGGASMWPIALLLAGTWAGIVGGASALGGLFFRR